ncbi:ATP-grasp domain-containing protein [Mycobacteroides abscessus]
MRVLVLNRYGLSSIRYADWLEGCSAIVLITSAQSLSPSAGLRRQQIANYTQVVEFEDYTGNPEVLCAAAELHEKYRFDRIIAMSEYDILRAAQLRELLAIPGQGVEDALKFRDKVAMKEALGRSGLPIAEYAPVNSMADILGFVRHHGYPIVVKPRRGAGSNGVFVIHNGEELASSIKEMSSIRGDENANLIVEEYIENELYQVDGVLFDGEVLLSWPSYTTSTLAFQQGDVCTASMLDADSPLRVPLQNMAAAAMRALPSPAVTIFHIEIFSHRSRGLVLNEVAERMSGGKFDVSLSRAFDVNFEEWYVRSALRESPWHLPRLDPKVLCGEILVAQRPGVLVSAPSVCNLPGVTGYGLSRSVGERLSAPSSIGEFMAWLTVESESGDGLESTLDRAVQWITDSIQISSGT